MERRQRPISALSNWSCVLQWEGGTGDLLLTEVTGSYSPVRCVTLGYGEEERQGNLHSQIGLVYFSSLKLGMRCGFSGK